MSTAADVVLASASPRRRDLLAALGVAVTVMAADVDERALPGEPPPALVARLAAAKAGAVQARLAALRGAAADGPDGADPLVIAADTVVVVDGEVLGKPADAAERRAFIERLAGRSHVVLSGHCLWRGQDTRAHVERTVVTFRSLDERDVAAYVASGEGDDKAGAYAIQGRGAGLVERIEGCYSNVVGLSLPTVITLARALGVRLG
ncbi:MAG: septum formation protein Maf [Trueperaceae bacterium]|nr:MAG: septum formation protein Maf [Trueperaceae bacterium]